jgi:tRNA (adenine57-N1/adenine58-N1)-methyltransferase
MSKILIKLPRYTEHNGEQRCVSKAGRWYVKDPSKPFHSSFGEVPVDVLQNDGKHIIGKDEYCVFEAEPIDIYRQLGQNVQKITLKDLGFIAAYIGVHSDMTIAESGSGSGGATCFFAPLVKQIYSYDIRDDAAPKIANDLKIMGTDNVTLKTGDVTKVDDIDCEDIDFFLLDVPEPWKAWETMKKTVKVGGWVVGYTPNANQMQEFVNTAPEEFWKEHSCELIERHWRVRGKICRPETADFSHTAFLTFYRRIC